MSYNLAFFNGDVRRDRKQEAMLRSMNERDNFLHRLNEMEKKRAQDEKQDRAVRKIQKLWHGHKKRQAFRYDFRIEFDKLVEVSREKSVSDVHQMSKLLVNFYEAQRDEERLVMTLVELVKARTANRAFEDSVPDTRRLLLARCCVKFLNHATENTIFFHVFRYLEDYVLCNATLFEQASVIGLFDAQFHLFEALVGKREGTIEKLSISPRHLQLLSRIFNVFTNSATQTQVTMKTVDRLLRTMCVALPIDLFTNYVLHFIKDHVKPGSQNYVTFLEAMKAVNMDKWKVPAQLLESATLRLRSLFLAQIDHVDRSNEKNLIYFFDSLAAFLTTNKLPNMMIPEDLSEFGRLRTAAVRYIQDYCQSMLNSESFRRSACTYSNLSCINVETIISLRNHFMQLLDTLSASNSFVEAVYGFISSHTVSGDLELGGGNSKVSSALVLFCSCLNKRVSTVADSDFVPANVFIDFDNAVEFLRDTSIKLINLMFPNLPRGGLFSGKQQNLAAEAEWKDVSDAVFAILGAVYQKDIRLKHFPEGFWVSHGREMMLGIMNDEYGMIPRRRLRSGRLQIERTVDSEFVERLASIYESDSDSEDEDQKEENDGLPVSLRRAICIMKQIPFIVRFMDRVKLFNRLLRREQEKHYADRYHDPYDHSHGGLTVRREHLYMDAFEQFAPRLTGDRVNELKGMVRVKMVNWVGTREQGVDGGGIFREFLSEALKTAFNVEQGFFTYTESRLLYPNPTAPFLLGADCLSHFQFIGRMLGKMIYEKQLQEVRFAEFLITQIFESSNKDVDLQHMKSFDPLIYKHLKNLLQMKEHELDDLQLDFSVVTNDMGLVRNVNLKPNGANHRVNVDNVHEYVRLYVNHHLKLRIASMVAALRKGISEVISIEWLRMFAPHEIQILIAGHEGVFTAREMRSHCEMRFQHIRERDDQYAEMFWDVVENLSPEDKRSLLKFITGCSRPPVDGFKSISPPMGILVVSSSDDQLPTSATCMNMLTVPKYSTRTKLEEKLRYAINSGAGFELA